MELPVVVVTTESLNFCFLFGGATFEADNIGLSTSISGATAIAAGATAADSLVIHQGKERNDKDEDE